LASLSTIPAVVEDILGFLIIHEIEGKIGRLLSIISSCHIG
jgi:hypothetical protein